jgi:hypothetical protein
LIFDLKILSSRKAALSGCLCYCLGGPGSGRNFHHGGTETPRRSGDHKIGRSGDLEIW